MELWYKTYSKPHIRLTTQLCYENRIYLHIIPSIGEIPLNKLTQSDLQKFYADLKKNGRKSKVERYGTGVSDRLVRSCHATCRTALQKAVDEKLISVNPAIGCKDDFYELALLELATGMRRGEICALKWSDLDFETGALHIQRQAYHVDHGVVISEPKTKQSCRSIILPPSVLNVLRQYREAVDSEWMFPSPVKEGEPLNPNGVYRKMVKILDRAQCKRVRFHDLRHTFATTALEHGMDIKTLSAIIGHVSSATTLDIYSHITDEMQANAANKIEKRFSKNEPFEQSEYETQKQAPSSLESFEPYKGKIRKSGTGGIYELNDHLFEGRYSPTNAYGKREVHTVYAKTREECERLLGEMIPKVRAEIKAEKERLKAEETAQE